MPQNESQRRKIKKAQLQSSLPNHILSTQQQRAIYLMLQRWAERKSRISDAKLTGIEHSMNVSSRGTQMHWDLSLVCVHTRALPL